MKKNLLLVLIILLFGAESYIIFITKSGYLAMLAMFFSGIVVGMCLVGLKLNLKNDKINIYKRELEKESISSSESSSKVKVLEAKIQTLEKALENALKK